MRSAICALLMGALAACARAPDPAAPLPPRVNAVVANASAPLGLPPMRRFSGTPGLSQTHSNADLVRDFLDLSFELESGSKLDRFTRVEGPIRVAVAGRAPPDVWQELEDLMVRLRSEAGLSIALSEGGPAQITVNAISRRDIQRALPNAACFVLPGVSSFEDFRGGRSEGLDWTRLNTRSRMAVFIPNDAPPQEMRDCLHEEIAQALGPVNDLYRLPFSVFNDDNMHTVLTDFDMLILRATYDPALRSGMTRSEVAARLPAIFARINPEGQNKRALNLPDTPRIWINAVDRALRPAQRSTQRRRAARVTLDIARAQGWQDHRLGFAHFINGLVNTQNDAAARAAYQAAAAVFARAPHMRLQQAFAEAQLAAFALDDGAPDQALALTERAIPVAQAAQNATLLAMLHLMRAQSLEQLGQPQAAQTARLDSLGWARYGFGIAGAVRKRINEIAALLPSDRG